jgi:Lrp/AsnC family transcriptional regulator, regulator for asnA, asnC and gidA
MTDLGCEDRTMVSSKKQSPLDAVSKTIIELLQDDGRRSYSDIGRVVGLSEAAVRQRVQRLTESGVMQIVAVTDPMQLGFHRQAMIGMRVSGDARRVAEAVAEIEAIDYVVITVGAFDVLAEVVCEDDEDLLSLINDVIRPIDGVLSTETFIYAKLQKQLYNWGTR